MGHVSDYTVFSCSDLISLVGEAEKGSSRGFTSSSSSRST